MIRNARNASLDMMYHIIGERSVHAAIVRNIGIETVVTQDEVDNLRINPPTGTRAWVRGNVLRVLRKTRHEILSASWGSIRFKRRHRTNGYYLDLNDPFSTDLCDLDPAQIIKMVKNGSIEQRPDPNDQSNFGPDVEDFYE